MKDPGCWRRRKQRNVRRKLRRKSSRTRRILMLGFYKTSKSDIKDGEQTEWCFTGKQLYSYKRVLVGLYVLRLNSFMIIKMYRSSRFTVKQITFIKVCWSSRLFLFCSICNTYYVGGLLIDWIFFNVPLHTVFPPHWNKSHFSPFKTLDLQFYA